MKITVLVAVYNAEKYLNHCLDSLVNQTYRDLEIICIDDASTDMSWEILKEYASRDSRIILLKQSENGGQAKARNRGLEIATGDYVTMLDSDDWFSPDALELAVETAEKSTENDCVMFDVCYYDQKTGDESGYGYRTSQMIFTGEEAFRLSLDWSVHGLYMLRRSIHQAYPYDTTCRLFSDDNTTRIHYLHSRCVCRCSGVYHYRRHEESMTHRISVIRFQYLQANYNMKLTLMQEQVAGHLLDFYEAHRWYNLVGMYVFYYTHKTSFSTVEQKHIQKELRHFYDTIEPKRLSGYVKWKFGYVHISFSVRLFELQVLSYTWVRKWAYRLCQKSLPEN